MRKLLSSTAAFRIASFFHAVRRISAGIRRLLPVRQSNSVSASRKLAITNQYYRIALLTSIVITTVNEIKPRMRNFHSTSAPHFDTLSALAPVALQRSIAHGDQAQDPHPIRQEAHPLKPPQKSPSQTPPPRPPAPHPGSPSKASPPARPSTTSPSPRPT